jgi:hypothetical protein
VAHGVGWVLDPFRSVYWVIWFLYPFSFFVGERFLSNKLGPVALKRSLGNEFGPWSGNWSLSNILDVSFLK